MSTISELVGRYEGRNRIRAGKEEELNPAERKRYLKNAEVVPLELRLDGTFTFKKATTGRFDVKGSVVRCMPTTFNGQSLEAMRAAAEEAGRTFGLAFLFNPFELMIEDGALVSGDSRSILYVEYRRCG